MNDRIHSSKRTALARRQGATAANEWFLVRAFTLTFPFPDGYASWLGQGLHDWPGGYLNAPYW
jgi:hypothetical protein